MVDRSRLFCVLFAAVVALVHSASATVYPDFTLSVISSTLLQRDSVIDRTHNLDENDNLMRVTSGTRLVLRTGFTGPSMPTWINIAWISAGQSTCKCLENPLPRDARPPTALRPPRWWAPACSRTAAGRSRSRSISPPW